MSNRQYKNVTRGIGGYSVGVELEGDWLRVKHLLDDLDDTIEAGALKGQMSAAKKLRKIVRKHIRTSGGSLGWAPLSPNTVRVRASKGYDPSRLLYMTGSYYRSIKVWKKGKKSYVGVKANTPHPITGKPLGQIAMILEYGSQVRNIPARPLWLPSFKQFGKNKRVKKLIVWHIQNEFRIRHGISPKINI